ncbi:MAG: AAA family ATPase [Rhodanobacteraceae bacterium]
MRAELERAGFVVFPLGPDGKPRAKGWKDPNKRWRFDDSDNAGIYCGAHREHGALVAIDVDTKNGKRGEDSLRALEDEHGALPITREHATKSGGRHLIFYVPAPVQSSAGRLGEGLDVRSAGGFLVAPGSFIGGKPYTVSCGGPIAKAPQWLIDLCGQQRERDAKAAEPLPGVDAERARKRAVEYLTREAPEAIEGAGGDETTFKVACAVKDQGVPEDECTALMLEHWNERCAPPWSPDDLAAKVRNAYAYGSNRQGSDAPEAIFDPVPNASPRPNAERSLRLVDIRGIENATIGPPRFVVERIIPAGHVTLLGGHGGSGKSILALAIAAHVAAGQDWAGLAVEPSPALFVSLEDRGELVRWRLRKVIGSCGLEAARVERALRIVDGAAAGALMAESHLDGVPRLIETPIMRELGAMIADARLIVIDNASDAFDGNENARRQVRAFVQALAELGRPNDAAVLLLAHIDKNAARYGSNGNSYSGSSAWHNSARSRLALIQDKQSVELRHEKSNLGQMIRSLRLTWADGVLLPMVGGEGSKSEDDAAAVLAALRAAADAGVSVSPARSGSNNAQRTLATFAELPEWLRGSGGRDAFWAAINALRASGRVEMEQYRNADSKVRERFRVTVPAGAPAPNFNAAA